MGCGAAAPNDLGGWSWGLMDDYSLRVLSGGLWERIGHSLGSMVSFGVFRPVAAVHYAILYKVFENNPQGFYIFRWVECVASIGVWAYLSQRVTRSRFAVPLFLFVVLSFYKFYDAFFFLSIQEILGVLFFGIALLGSLNALEAKLEHGGPVHWGWCVTAGISLVLAFGSKDLFCVTGIALGLGLLIVAFMARKKGLFGFGATVLAAGAAYALMLKLFIVKGYSSSYEKIDLVAIGQNVQLWVQKDLLSHAPWIVLSVALLLFVPRKNSWTVSRHWCFLTGALAYAGYLILLLPWSTWGHYAGPLGVFFAFTLTVLIADKLEDLNVPASLLIGVAAFVFALTVGGMALKFQSGYQADTANLMKWLSVNDVFAHDIESGAVVRGNAWEPCSAIVTGVSLAYGKKFPEFVFTANVGDVLKDIRTRYYLWNPFWGDQDLSRLGHMWTPMYVSEHWILFRRMY